METRPDPDAGGEPAGERDERHRPEEPEGETGERPSGLAYDFRIVPLSPRSDLDFEDTADK